MGSKPSDGQLNTAFRFKFGGKPLEQKKPLTLSDIIPPPSHQLMLANASMTEDDSAVLNSIYAKAIDIAPTAPRMRVDSDSSSKRRARHPARAPVETTHNRHSSELSFAGFSSSEEVRRGFEFANRQAFYPPIVSSRLAHRKHESVFSIASVSSYGFIINPGSTDPFDYGQPMRERPLSEISTLSMSMTHSPMSIVRHGSAGELTVTLRASTSVPPLNRRLCSRTTELTVDKIRPCLSPLRVRRSVSIIEASDIAKTTPAQVEAP
jgi:serine/arginine repetitive matrix protein 2